MLGWSGGFVWVLILSVVVWVDGQTREALLGLVILGASLASILFFAPWRHPSLTYRRLMTPIYILFFAAIAWGVWALGDARQIGITGWGSALLLVPLSIPFVVLGPRRWRDGDT